MNYWTEKSIELANQRNYLDLLYKIYPMSVNLRRDLEPGTIEKLEKAFDYRNDKELLNILLKQKIFPIKDSYVSYLRKDKTAIERNPNTVARITGILYDMGIDEIIERTSAPKETNRQIGPLFKNWIDSRTLGCEVTNDTEKFIKSKDNIIYNTNDTAMAKFAREFLGYTREKGLDFIGKFNSTYIIAEAKFLTDFGGHQNAQFEDAISTMRHEMEETDNNVKVISILDGVLYIPGKHKMFKKITTGFEDDEVIISAVLLRDYLYSI